MSWNSATFYRRLMAKVRVNEKGCWIFTGFIGRDGYGQIWYNGRLRLAHIASFLWFRGIIPDDCELDHIECDTRACCNPWHVEPVSHMFNVQRGNAPCAIRFRSARCKRGHAMVEGNLFYRPDRPNTPECGICLKIRNYRKSKTHYKETVCPI